MKYRSEIDGLRSIAVIPVVLFHAGIPGFSGGYIGVDVFFVISGFLITGIILQEINKQKFSIAIFYERRIRRILPALLSVILISCLLSYLILLPYQQTEFAWSAASSLVFLSNFFFWKLGGYFAETSELKPLLHTWSLAIEEQYYIFFPVLLILLARFKIIVQIFCLGLIIILSLMLSEWAWRFQPGANFFVTPTRIWELMIGSLTAYASSNSHFKKKQKTISKTQHAISFISLIILLTSLFTMNSSIPIPSLWGLIPVTATALILYFGTKGTLVSKILSLRPFVWIGLLSYSIYLWHQPILAFSRALIPEQSYFQKAALITFILILAFLTWKFIETPFRNRKDFPRRKVYISLSILTGIIIASLALTILTRGFAHTFPQHHQEWLLTSPIERGGYVMTRSIAATDRIQKNLPPPSILIVGDSYAQDFYNIMAESKTINMNHVATYHIRSSCQIYYGSGDISEFRPGRNAKLCKTRAVTKDLAERMQSIKTIIFAMRWRTWAAERMGETLDALNLQSDQNLFVVGSKAFTKQLRDYLSVHAHDLPAITSPAPLHVVQMNNTLQQSIEGRAKYIDLMDYYCINNSTKKCRLFTDSGNLISYDGGHLTQHGALFLSKKMKDIFPIITQTKPENKPSP